MGKIGSKYGDLKRSTKNSITEMHIREHYKGVAELYTFFIHFIYIYLQGVPKKMSFSGKTAITTFKLIQNAKVGGVLENSGYLLHHGH